MEKYFVTVSCVREHIAPKKRGVKVSQNFSLQIPATCRLLFVTVYGSTVEGMGSDTDSDNDVQSCHTNSNLAELNMLLEEVIALETEIKGTRNILISRI